MTLSSPPCDLLEEKEFPVQASLSLPPQDPPPQTSAEVDDANTF